MTPTQIQLQSVIDIDLEIADKSAIRDANNDELNQLFQTRGDIHQSVAPSLEPGKIYRTISSVDGKEYAIYNNNNAPASYLSEEIS
jgi:hypothetical protein